MHLIREATRRGTGVGGGIESVSESQLCTE